MELTKQEIEILVDGLCAEISTLKPKKGHTCRLSFAVGDTPKDQVDQFCKKLADAFHAAGIEDFKLMPMSGIGEENNVSEELE